MDNQSPPKWYFKTWSLIVSFFCLGPFMLPLVWGNPRFSNKLKVIITVAVIVLTYILTELLLKSLKAVVSYADILSKIEY